MLTISSPDHTIMHSNASAHSQTQIQVITDDGKVGIIPTTSSSSYPVCTSCVPIASKDTSAESNMADVNEGKEDLAEILTSPISNNKRTVITMTNPPQITTSTPCTSTNQSSSSAVNKSLPTSVSNSSNAFAARSCTCVDSWTNQQQRQTDDMIERWLNDKNVKMSQSEEQDESNYELSLNTKEARNRPCPLCNCTCPCGCKKAETTKAEFQDGLSAVSLFSLSSFPDF